ncbi:hypothetical protein [Novosphingobium sp.]|uniref:hypothetical protein n=1 Tax=Novosphingobium sp. TaxID=1874826 RepID=UPI002736EC84|nr:hypothetical protein [Novosphingobium sp.]MDP3907536.1 hypothetical protein [Novosphingobium sp.]
MLVAAFLLIAAAVMAAMLLWSLSVYALPLWIGALTAMATWQAGNDLVLCAIAGLAAATATLILGHWLLAMTSSPLLRAFVALGFALPAAVAGYHAAHGLAVHVLTPQWVRTVVSLLCAVLIGGSAWTRCLAPPRRV